MVGGEREKLYKQLSSWQKVRENMDYERRSSLQEVDLVMLQDEFLGMFTFVQQQGSLLKG